MRTIPGKTSSEPAEDHSEFVAQRTSHNDEPTTPAPAFTISDATSGASPLSAFSPDEASPPPSTESTTDPQMPRQNRIQIRQDWLSDFLSRHEIDIITESSATELGPEVREIPAGEVAQPATFPYPNIRKAKELRDINGGQEAAARAVIVKHKLPGAQARSMPKVRTAGFDRARGHIEEALGYSFKQDSWLLEALYNGAPAAIGSRTLTQGNRPLAQLGDAVLEIIMREICYDLGIGIGE